MTVPYIFANATGAIALAKLDANFANVSAYVDTAGTVTANDQPNITSVGVLNSVRVSGTVTGSRFIGSGNSLSNIQGSNVSGSVARSNYANVANTANAVQGSNVSGSVAQSNYANVANTVSGANVSGSVAQSNYANIANAVQGSNVSGSVAQADYANTANAVAGANVSGSVASALTAQTVSANAQPNITSVGILSNVSITGNVTANGIGSLNGNLTISANTAQPELAWSVVTDSFGIGTSILLAPTSDDQHTGQINLPGSTGNATISFAGPDNGPFSNAVNIISNQSNILLTTTPDGEVFYISTFDQAGNFDIPGNVTANGIGSLSGNLTISANTAQPELAWSLINNSFGPGTSVLLGPLSDDQHTGELVFPGSIGAGTMAYAGPDNGPFSNAFNIISAQSNLLLSTTPDGEIFYISTFDQAGNFDIPGNVTANLIGSLSGNLTISANTAQPELAWSIVNDHFGIGTSILLAPTSDDQHTGQIVLPGSTGSGYIAYSGPDNGLLSNALSISSDANILITQLSNVTSYITTFNTDGDWLMPNNVSVTGNVTSNAISVTGFAQLPQYSVTDLTATVGNIGYVVALIDSDPIGVLAFWNVSSSAWCYVGNSTPV